MNYVNSELYKNSNKFIFEKLRESVLNANERLNSELDKTYLKFYEIINPNELHQLQRKIEILELQKDIINIYLDGMQNKEILKIYYLEKIRETKENVFILNYKNLLNARDAIYYDGQFLKLDEETKSKELKRFSDHLDEVELPLYENCPIPNSLSEVDELFSKIESEIQFSLKKIDEIRNKNEIAYDQYEDSAQTIKTVRETLNNELLDYANNTFQIDEIDLIIKGCNLNLLKQMLHQHNNKKKFLKENCPDALHIACEAGDIEIVKYLIKEMRFDNYLLSKDGYYPINYAVKNLNYSCRDIMNYLYEIDKNIIHMKAIHGRTPLHTATVFDNLTAAKWLIEKGANVNQSETGSFQKETPLHNASFNGNTFMVEMLLDYGADVHATNTKGTTPLMHAIKEGHLDVAHIYFKRGFWLTDLQLELLLKYPLEEKQRMCLEMPPLKFLEKVKKLSKKFDP